ncbi:Protein of unknown function [Pseudomonas delhiensis]|uniref:DUF2514 domain-containing protein n=1 Tax=Pseudomonas delhiensis TaxID=366289 RepID=A0A239MY41_9PSED|nr:DUF2514 family protein [Pseudomonas delhiensis]SDK41192.1 Protein of unknown function [Pseudomonas delhiensis]SNT47727.1 Protein of unknown function [Pseudomonas delhiensis]
MTWLLSYWRQLLMVLIIAAVGIGCWRHGVTTTDAAWQAKWDQHLAADAAATAQAQAEQRVIEQNRQQSINKLAEDGQRAIDKAQMDAAAARASAGSLRDAADKLATRLAASEARGDTCTAGASKAAAAAARVLADVLKRADERAGRLADIADQSRARGLACEAAYAALR